MIYQKRINSVLLFTAFFVNVITAQNYTVRGKITDALTGENISGVNIVLPNDQIGTISNRYGFYSILIEAEETELLYSFLGYERVSVTLQPNSDTTINLELTPIPLEIDEVVISANSERNIQALEMGIQRLNIKEINSIPAFAGEPDVIRSIQYLPGVTTGNEGVNNISIRGGSTDQNLILLDEAILFNTNHALSFFSTFNPDAVSNVSFYKTSFPAKYGGRLSSVIDVSMREGNNQKFHLSGGIGLLASRLSIEGPIKKNKSSFILSGRYSYAGVVANSVYSLKSVIPALNNYRKGNEINFYDLNFKYNTKLNENNQIYISGYLGKDHFYFKNFSDNFSMDWGNISSTIRWNHIYNAKLFSNTTFVFSNYNYEYSLLADARDFLWSSNMQNFQLKSDFDFYISNSSKISFGVFSGLLITLPGKISPASDSSQIRSYSMEHQKSLELGGYLELERRIADFLNIRIGLRFTSFSELGPATVYNYTPDGTDIIDSMQYSDWEFVETYNKVEPRVLFNFILNSRSSIKVSYNKTYQYLHLLTNSSIGLPTDIWLPSGASLVPKESNQYSLGFFNNFMRNRIESSVEIYYKKMANIIDFRDNADLFLNKHIESQILFGEANAYGIEFYLKKRYGELNGWISYTFS
ncbi:MAG: TonB-dependent receptor, partial [Bacteroidales bacterium]